MNQKKVLEILMSGKSIFLTGSAGTGKTYILNQYIQYLKERKINPSVVAPTGIAASHIGGSTIHSFFGIGIREDVDEYFLDSLMQRKYLYDRFRNLKVLIIDEISMVSPKIFDSMDRILRNFKGTSEPFGGVQVILSGDFFQLPPVSKNIEKKVFSWQAEAWKNLNLKTCYLEENFRQEENQITEILNDIRSGEISENSFANLEKRYQKNLESDFVPTKLFTHNEDVDKINQKELENLKGEEKNFECKKIGPQKETDKILKSSLLLESLKLKKNALVIFVKNNYEKGYINGTCGIVEDFEKESGNPIVKTFSGQKIVADRQFWNIEDENQKIKASVSQIPLRLAWAITIHKSQGMTLDAAEIDLSKTFQSGQGYVALSRLKSLDGLKLMGINDMALKVNSVILQIDERMKQASKRAEEENEKILKEEKEKMSIDFLQKIGAILDEEEIEQEKENLKKQKNLPQEKTKSWKKTMDFLESKKSLEEIADIRAVALNTIFNHLEEIKKNTGEFKYLYLKPEKNILESVEEAMDELKKEKNPENFLDDGSIKLKAIFEILDKQISYEDIKLSILFL